MFKLLSQFKVVGDTKNITKASEILGISQPTLTQNLSKLEKSFGVALFVRKKHGIELTEAGENLYKNAVQTLKAYDHTLKSMMKIKENSKRIFSIGCGYNWSHTPIFDSIKHVTKSYTDMTFNITSGESTFLQHKIMSNEYDIAMGSIPYDLVKSSDITYIPVFKSKFTIFAHKSHPLFSQEEITNTDLENYQWVILRHNEESQRADEFYDSFMTLNRVQYNCKSVSASLRLVQNSDLLILLPTNFKEVVEAYGLREIKTKNIIPEFESGIMFLKQNSIAEKISTEIVAYLDNKKPTKN